jgi:DNA polymerase-3 subunit gamma/tau
MSYQVLARRWRPKTFSDVVGQEHVTRTIKNALKQGRLAHAFLFTGPRGCGKTSTARILARAVNCPNIDLQGDAEPCNVCETCQALFEDREMDVIEMDAASNTSVDDVRTINDNCRLAPIAGKKKIYIIDEVHMLSRSAFNAFLKTLEEPPEHVIFILATTDVHKVPATILSRVQRFDFRPVQPSDVAPHLAKICAVEGWPASMEALWLIARRGEGSLRDAEGLLDQVVSFSGGEVSLEATRDVLGVLPGELLADATRLLGAKALAQIPEFLDGLVLKGVDYTELLKALQSYWMDLIFIKETLPVKGVSEDEAKQMTDAGAELSVDDLFRLIRLAETLENDLRWSTAPRVRFEVSFLRWSTLDRVANIRDILDRVGGTPSSGSVPVSNQTVNTVTAPARPETAKPQVSAPPAATPIERNAPPKPEPVPESAAVTPSAPASLEDLSLESLKALWPTVMQTLRRKNQAAASIGERSWILDSLQGKKLTLCCTTPGKFATDQMKGYFPDLGAALTEVCGTNLVLIAGASKAPSPETGDKPAAPPPPKPADPSDLFAVLKNRFGGVEIDPDKAREPQ